MKDEKAKYLFIDSTEIHKQLYNTKREAAFNDWWNVYTPDRIIDAKEIFDIYNIPEEFQKIIVKISKLFFIKYEATEYTMDFPFDITSSKIEKENNDKYISAYNYPIFYDNLVFRDEIKFKTPFKFSKFNEVNEFLSQIENSGYLISYLKSIEDFFNIALKLDYQYEGCKQKKLQKRQ